MILLLTFAVQHKLTNEAISDDLLYISGLVCPQPNHCCSSLHKFKQYFSFMMLPAYLFYYCPSCFDLLDSLATTVCAACKRMFKSAKEILYFVHFFISDQIKTLFAKENFYNYLSCRFQRSKLQEESYEDIMTDPFTNTLQILLVEY